MIIALIHFSTPLIYYQYAKMKWLSKPWNIKTDTHYCPHLSIIVPTYNESRTIKRKLENILREDYPSSLMEVIVVDSASNDGTADLARDWGRIHPELNVRVLEEKERKGKLRALLHAFGYVNTLSEFLIVSDADSEWQRGSVSETAKYFADPAVAVVTSSLSYSNNAGLESSYREYYNTIRVAESKEHSTPIQSGVFQAIRLSILGTIGLPLYAGADDSAIGSYLAFAGFRSIQVDDVHVSEPLRGHTFSTKVRRAQHVILNFLFTKSYAKRKGVYRKTAFDRIWIVEFWFNVLNCWLPAIVVALLLLSVSLAFNPAPLLIILVATIMVSIKPYRIWLSQQVYLVLGFLGNSLSRRELWNR
jgi:cellulose synthase/poly-beta-1,6-N-acetylglucosamine synthase-like glycosyltransferase